jgi:hypothetical protein
MWRSKYVSITRFGRNAVLIFRFFYPAEGSYKILVIIITELKGVIFHKRVILILTVLGLILFNRLKDSGNYMYHTSLKVKKIWILFTECTGVLHTYVNKKLPKF